ncbi:MAG: hypothetical protein ABIG73_02570 [Patescibacteria group bacterium]
MKKTRFFVLAVVFVAVAMLASCATYNTRGTIPNLGRIEEKKIIRQSDGKVTIIAFPIMNQEDSERYFDENLLESRVFSDRILAVFLEARNNSSEIIKVDSATLKIGEVAIVSAPSDVAYKLIRREYAGKAFLWMAPTLYIGGPISLAHTANINSKIEGDLKEKAFVFGEIKANGSSVGFVWFQVSDKEMAGDALPKGMTLVVKLTNKEILLKLPDVN